MSKAKTVMVYFLSFSLVFAFMLTTIPTLANAETLTPSEPGVSLGKPLSDATLKEYTAKGVLITVYQLNTSTYTTPTNTNTQTNTVIIPNSTPPVNNTITGPGTFTTKVTVPYWFRKK